MGGAQELFEMAEQSLIGRSRLAGRVSWSRMRESMAMHLGYFDWAPAVSMSQSFVQGWP